jgi:hypothetical protein
MTEPPHRTSRPAALLFGVLLALSVANFPAAAQNPPPAGNPVDRQLQMIHQRLHITPAQEPDFNAFADAWRSNAEKMRSLIQQRPTGANVDVVERLRFQQKLVAANAESLQRLIAPLARLYASFSPTQKRLANEMFTPRPAGSGRG